ncbi:hypothetical protein ZWY2020_044439 [Hordeum vulgare]|nr:hypothetical protein ZWY2020_044439 [Hordeum vulgare]
MHGSKRRNDGEMVAGARTTLEGSDDGVRGMEAPKRVPLSVRPRRLCSSRTPSLGRLWHDGIVVFPRWRDRADHSGLDMLSRGHPAEEIHHGARPISSRDCGDRRLLSAKPGTASSYSTWRSLTAAVPTAPRQPSPAGSGFTWLIPPKEPPSTSMAARQDGLSSAIAATASIHYPISSLWYAPAPRTCSQMWPKLVAEAKGDGADCIETYFFLKLDKGIVSGINAARHSDGNYNS